MSADARFLRIILTTIAWCTLTVGISNFALAHSREVLTAFEFEKSNMRTIAARLYDRARKMHPREFEAHAGYVRMMSSIGRSHDLRKEYLEYSLQKNNNSTIFVILADLYMYDLDDALSFADRALEVEPSSTAASNIRGLLILYKSRGTDQKLIQTAVSILQTNAQANPDDSRSQIVYGIALSQIGKNREAIEVTKAGISDPIRATWAYSMIAQYYFKLDQPEQGKEHINKARQSHPYHVLSYRWLGDYYFSIGNYEDAIREYEQGLGYHYGEFVLYNSLAWAMGAVESHSYNPKKAREIAKYAVLLTERKIESFLDTLAEIEFRLGNVESAIELAKEALKIHSDDEYYHNQLQKFRDKQ